jgi:MEMO1 family protein
MNCRRITDLLLPRRLASFYLILLVSVCVGAVDCQGSPVAPRPAAAPTPTAEGEKEMVFQPVVAGQFYPADPQELGTQVDQFIEDANVPSDLSSVFGIVSPHAGYVYSGAVAGHSFAAVKDRKPDVVVVLGLSHRTPGEIAVLDYDAYLTPLGKMMIDRKAVDALAEQEKSISRSDAMFLTEHSLEVQLPFIQRTFPGVPVVLIAIGRADRNKLERLARALHAVFADRDALFVASTDLSHFRSYDAASQIDNETLAFLAKCDLDGLYKSSELRDRMCGLAPVTALYLTFKEFGGKQARLLNYRNSGDTSGDRNRVVGYGAVALLADGEASAATPKGDGDDFLSTADKKELLTIARQTVEKFVRDGKAPNFPVTSPVLLADGAAFVTLHKNPGHRLRGCIGQIMAQMPLWKCVREMAVAAASQDPRFPEVKPGELNDLHVEISVLTPPVAVRDVTEIEVGKHGLIIGQGWQRGLLLPQVPTEQGWDRETFLNQTCRKAGLPADCWRSSDVKIEKFSAVVFSE